MALSAPDEHIKTLSMVKARLHDAFPTAQFIKVIDNTPPQSVGKGAHLTLQIKSPDFKGLTLVRRHRIVSTAMDDLLESNRIHAISYLLDD